MKQMTTTLLFIIFFSLQSFSQSSIGEINGNTYHCEKIGWTIKIPDKYSVASKSERVENAEKVAKAINNSKIDKQNVLFLLSFKKDSTLKIPVFLSGLQNKNTVGVPIKTEKDFIDYAHSLLKKASPDVELKTFEKEISGKKFLGYQSFFPSKRIYQRGLIKIIGNWVFYQTWIFEKEEDAIDMESEIFNARLR